MSNRVLSHSKPRVYLCSRMGLKWRQQVLNSRRWLLGGPDFENHAHEAPLQPWHREDQERRAIHMRCRDQIDSCDALFAYITDGEAYGSLVEIGYAARGGKLIGICFDERVSPELRDELWFATEAADYQWTGRVHAAFEAFLGAIEARRG